MTLITITMPSRHTVRVPIGTVDMAVDFADFAQGLGYVVEMTDTPHVPARGPLEEQAAQVLTTMYERALATRSPR